MPRPPEFRGAFFTIRALELSDGSSPAADFLAGLDRSDRRKLDVLFEMLGQTGRISNKEKFKKLEGTDGIFEFKSFQIRIPCFFTPDKEVLLCFGLIKKQDRYKSEEIQRAENYRKQYVEHRGRK